MHFAYVFTVHIEKKGNLIWAVELQRHAQNIFVISLLELGLPKTQPNIASRRDFALNKFTLYTTIMGELWDVYFDLIMLPKCALYKIIFDFTSWVNHEWNGAQFKKYMFYEKIQRENVRFLPKWWLLVLWSHFSLLGVSLWSQAVSQDFHCSHSFSRPSELIAHWMAVYLGCAIILWWSSKMASLHWVSG